LMSQAGQTGSRHAPDVTKSEYGNLSWILRIQTINPQVFSMARRNDVSPQSETLYKLSRQRNLLSRLNQDGGFQSRVDEKSSFASEGHNFGFDGFDPSRLFCPEKHAQSPRRG
jgi:hypothetical protein